MRRSSPRLPTDFFLLVAAIWFSLVLVGIPAWTQTTGFSISTDFRRDLDILREIDLETGAFVEIGSVGDNGIAALTMASDGSLWAVSTETDELLRIDPSDAFVTTIGSFDIPLGLEAGLTFDACGTLWMISGGTLFEVDPMTAGTTERATFDRQIAALTSRNEQLIGIANPSPTRLVLIDPETAELEPFGDSIPFTTSWQGLDFDDEGNLWGVFESDAAIVPLLFRAILRFDPFTGEHDVILRESEIEVNFVRGNLAITPPRGFCGGPAEIPVDRTEALALLGFLLAAAALVAMRKL